MRSVTVTEAKANLSELIRAVLDGEEVVIGRHGKAEARLVAADRVDSPRPLGSIAVPDYWMSDDFDAPLDDLANDFESA